MGFNFPLFSVPVAFLLCYIPHGIRVAIAKKANAYDHTNPRYQTEFAEALSAEQAYLQRRLIGAHNNQLETIGVYAAGIVANVTRKSLSWPIHLMAALYIAFRVIYVVVYVSPQVAGGYLRSLAFMGVLGTIFAIWIRAFV